MCTFSRISFSDRNFLLNLYLLYFFPFPSNTFQLISTIIYPNFYLVIPCLMLLFIEMCSFCISFFLNGSTNTWTVIEFLGTVKLLPINTFLHFKRTHVYFTVIFSPYSLSVPHWVWHTEIHAHFNSNEFLSTRMGKSMWWVWTKLILCC